MIPTTEIKMFMANALLYFEMNPYNIKVLMEYIVNTISYNLPPGHWVL